MKVSSPVVHSSSFSSMRNPGTQRSAGPGLPTPGGHLDSFTPGDPPQETSGFGPRLLGGIAGAIVGGIAGSTGAAGAAATSGLAAMVATTATLGPAFKETVEEGLNGDPINDVALVCSATFAAGVTLSSFGAAAGMAGWALDSALPGSGRVVAALTGAAAGAAVGIWN